jgi:hypothetical protein
MGWSVYPGESDVRSQDRCNAPAFSSKDHQKPFILLNSHIFWSGKIPINFDPPAEMIWEDDPTAAARQDVSLSQST